MMIIAPKLSYAGKSDAERSALLAQNERKLYDKIVIIGTTNPNVTLIGVLVGINLEGGEDGGYYYLQKLHMLQPVQMKPDAPPVLQMTPYGNIGKPEERPDVYRVPKRSSPYIMEAPEETRAGFIQNTSGIVPARMPTQSR